MPETGWTRAPRTILEKEGPMTRHKLIRWAVAVACMPVLGACSDTSNAVAPVQPPTIDVGKLLDALSFADLNAFLGLRGLLGAPSTGNSPTIIPSVCTYSAGTQSFVCPGSTVGGVTYATSYFLYNGASQPQSAVDPATTASIRALINATGTATLPVTNGVGGTVSVTRRADLTFSGLQTTTRVLNGTTIEHDDVTTTGALGARSSIDLTTTSNNIVLPLQTASSRWPISGTLTSDVVAVTTLPPLPAVNTTAHAVLTFNGTSQVTVVTNVSGVVKTCRIDLAGGASPVC
jgi:hypothetical protein